MKKHLYFLSLLGLLNSVSAQEIDLNSMPYSFADIAILQPQSPNFSLQQEGEYLHFERSLENLIQIDIEKLKALLLAPAFTSSENATFLQNVKGEFTTEKGMNSLLDNLSLANEIQYPYQFLRLDYNNGGLHSLFGLYFSTFFKAFPQYQLNITPHSVEFATGDKLNNAPFLFKQNIQTHKRHVDASVLSLLENEINQSELLLFVLDSKKIIKNVQFSIEYPIFNKKEYTIENRVGEYALNGNQIKIVESNDNFLVLELPAKLAENILVQENQQLNYLARSEVQFKLTDDDKQYVQKWIGLLEQVYTQIKQGKLSRGREVNLYLEKHKPSIETKLNSDSVQIAYYYQNKPKEILIRFPEQVSVGKIDKVLSVQIPSESNQYYVANLFNTEKMGILDTEGNWLVRPNYYRLRMMNPYFFSDEYYQYHFNLENKSLTKVDYVVNDPTIYLDKFVKVEFYPSYLTNVADIKTGKLVFDKNYDQMEPLEGGFWLVRERDSQNVGVLRSDFSVLLPLAFSYIHYDNGFFYTNKRDKENIQISDVYNAKGESITKGKYQQVMKFNEGLLLAYKSVEKLNKSTGETRYETLGYVLDEQGKVILDLNKLNVQAAEEFSAGLLAVRDIKTELYGFIDRSGKWVVPPHYYDAKSFFPKSQYALVEFNELSCSLDKQPKEKYHFALIDKQGNIKQCFANVTEWNLHSDDQEHIYSNNKWYDDFGRPLPHIESE